MAVLCKIDDDGSCLHTCHDSWAHGPLWIILHCFLLAESAV